MPTEATVWVIDDDTDLRSSLAWLVGSLGWRVAAHESPDKFLAAYDPQEPGCLVIDLRLPGMSGLELQRQVRSLGGFHPFIMISGHGDLPVAVEAMKQGAVDFFEKPCSHWRLVDAIQRAIAQDALQRAERAEERDVRQRLDRLTPREREILERILAGQVTKQIAANLGISIKTVEVHRSRIMQKLEVESTSQLVWLMLIEARRRQRAAT
jgi:RNA polymerase sigma factor (sigma-70 family)